MATTTSQERMNDLYYNVNPKPHSEKAYQKTDPAPPVASVATVVGPSGCITVLVTSIYNRAPFPRGARYRVYADAEGKTLLHEGSGDCPFQDDLSGFERKPGMRVFISPQTVGTMAKILTPEQIAAAGH